MAGESHLIAGNESESFVERSAFFGSVKDKAIQSLCSRLFDDSPKQHLGDTSPSPFRFGEYIHDDTEATLAESGPTESVRQRSVQINAGAAADAICIILEANP